MGSSSSRSSNSAAISPEEEEADNYAMATSIPMATPVTEPPSTFTRIKRRLSGWAKIRLLPSYVDDMKDNGPDVYDEDEDIGLLDRFGVADEKSNWPRACPVVHLDIEKDFELVAERTLMRRLYNSWIFVFWTLVLNFIGAISATLTSYVTNPQTVIISFIIAIVQLFLYFIIYFRALYWAMRLRAHTLYIWFYIISIGWMALYAYILSQDIGLISIMAEPLAPGSQLPVKVNPIFPVVVFSIVIALFCYHIFMSFYFISAAFFWEFASERKRKDLLRKQYRTSWLKRWFGGIKTGLLGDADLDDDDFDDPNRPELGKTFRCILHYSPNRNEAKLVVNNSRIKKKEPVTRMEQGEEEVDAPPLPINEVSVPGKVHVTDILLTFEADEPVYDHVFHLNVPLETIATINKAGESSVEVAEKLTDMVPLKFHRDFTIKPPTCLKGPRVERDIMFDFVHSKSRDKFRTHLIKKWKAALKLAQTGFGKSLMYENRLRLLRQNKNRAEQHLLTHEDWRLLVERSWQEKFAAGQIVIPQNSVLSSLYYVTGGDLVIYLDTSANTASIIDDEELLNSALGGTKNVADMNDFKDMGLDSDDEEIKVGQKIIGKSDELTGQKVMHALFPSLPNPDTFRPQSQANQPRRSFYPMGGEDEYLVIFQSKGGKNEGLGLFFRKRRRKSHDPDHIQRIIIVQPPPFGTQADIADVRVGDEIVSIGGYNIEINNISQRDVGTLIKTGRYPLEIVFRRVGKTKSDALHEPTKQQRGQANPAAVQPTQDRIDNHGLAGPGVIVSLDNERKAKERAKITEVRTASSSSASKSDQHRIIGGSPPTITSTEQDLLSHRTISINSGALESKVDYEVGQTLKSKTITESNEISQDTITSFPELNNTNNNPRQNRLSGLAELEMAETRASAAAARMSIGMDEIDDFDSSDEEEEASELEDDKLLVNQQQKSDRTQNPDSSISIEIHKSEDDVSLDKKIMMKKKKVTPTGTVKTSYFGPIKHDRGIMQIRNVANNIVATATSFLFGMPTNLRYEKIVDGPIEPSPDDHGDDRLHQRKWLSKDDDTKSSVFGEDVSEFIEEVPTFEEVGQIRTGEIIGLIPWIINHPISVVRIEAKTDVTIQAVSYHHIAHVLKENPSFAISFYKYAAATLGERADRDENISCKRLLRSSERVESGKGGFEVKKLRRLLDDQPIRATTKTEFAERQKTMQKIRTRFQKNRDMEFDFLVDDFDNVIASISGMIEMRQKGTSQWEGVDTIQKSGIMEDRGGQLYITNQHICFCSNEKSFSVQRNPKLFGKIHLNDIYEIRSSGSEILLVTDDCRLRVTFPSDELTSYAKDLIVFLTETCSIEVAPYSYTIKGAEDQEGDFESDDDDDESNNSNEENENTKNEQKSSINDHGQKQSKAAKSKSSRPESMQEKKAGSRLANPLAENHHIEVFDKLLQVSVEKQAGLREDFFEVVTLLMQVLTPQDKIRLFKGSRSVTLKQNQTIIRSNEEFGIGAGSGTPGLYLLGGGEVCVQRSASGRRVQFAKYTEGAIFGIERFLTGSPSPSMIKVSSKIARVRYAPGDHCWLLLKNDPALAARFYQYATLQYMLRLRGPIITRAVTEADEIILKNNRIPVFDYEPDPDLDQSRCVIL